MNDSNATRMLSAAARLHPSAISSPTMRSYDANTSEPGSNGMTASRAMVGGCAANASRYERAQAARASSQGSWSSSRVDTRPAITSRMPRNTSSLFSTWL